MTRRSALIGSVVAGAIVAFVMAGQRRDRADDFPAPPGGTPPVREETAAQTGTAIGAVPSPPSQPTSQADISGERTAAAPSDPTPAELDFRELVEGIDPLLSRANVIVRAPDPATNGPDLEEMESRFRTQRTDPDWSEPMESRIFDQVSRVSGLRLVTFEAQCRETICRLKLFYPPDTNALSSSERLEPLAAQLGFSHVAQAVAIEENGVPMSLLYLQRP